MKIFIWLKISNHNLGLNYIFNNLKFWLDIFSDTSKYDIFIHNVNVPELNNKFNNYNILSPNDLLENIDVKKYNNLILSGNFIDKQWMGHALGLGSIYYYFTKYNYSWNIDANDSILEGDCVYYINKVENILINNNLPTLSYDYYLSLNQQRWSYGICFANNLQMKNIITRSFYKKVPRPGHGINLDEMVHLSLISSPHTPIAFITPDKLIHNGPKAQVVHYNKQRNCAEIFLHGKTIFRPVHPKTVIIT